MMTAGAFDWTGQTRLTWPKQAQEANDKRIDQDLIQDRPIRRDQSKHGAAKIGMPSDMVAMVAESWSQNVLGLGIQSNRVCTIDP